MSFPIPIGQALQGLLNTPTGTVGSTPHAAWEFSSTLREKAYQNRVREDSITLGGASAATTAFSYSAATYADPILRMIVNPNTVDFDQPKRKTAIKTTGGTTFFHFVNSKGQDNDILTMRFRGNTGNIDPRGSLALDANGSITPRSTETDTGALAKLRAFINLWMLTREPRLLEGSTRNEFSITYTSLVLPTPISFYGHYDSALKFTESGGKPFSRDYSFDFVVERTIPDLDDVLGQILEVSQDVEIAAASGSTLFGAYAIETSAKDAAGG